MQTHDSDSISRWFDGLHAGDEVAVELLWRHYFPRLVGVARGRFGNAAGPAYDAEDAAQSAFAHVCRHIAAGGCERLRSRSELWALLVAATRNKVIDQTRRETAAKRGGDAPIQSLAAADSRFGLLEVVSPDPSPSGFLVLQESLDRLLDVLRDDTLRAIALALLEGETQQEIASRLQVSSRTIRRKVALIREDWEKLLASESNPD